MCIFIHMSAIYLGADLPALADRLARELDGQAKDGDFFESATIVVPNRYVKKWLRLWLARRLDVAINLRFQNLEESLWELLSELDPAAKISPPTTVEDSVYRLMVLSVLLEEDDPDLEPLQRYLQLPPRNANGSRTLSRLSCRRAWYLADRIGLRLQDYEYHRQDELIQPWLKHELGLSNATMFQRMMERAQRAVFLHITREPDGKRAIMSRLDETSYKTFPQYVMERMTISPPALDPELAGRTIHFFGFTHISALHGRAIGWLARHHDIKLYHLNLATTRATNDLTASATALLDVSDDATRDPGRALLRLWGGAGVEALGLVATVQKIGKFDVVTARSSINAPATTVLGRFRELMQEESPTQDRLPQDTSLQITACPGIAREVETVYNSIVHNLQADPTLRQTDIVVVATDLATYRPALQAAFERPPKRFQYNLVDFSAAGLSMFGQAVLGMLDLALESFARSAVFGVLLNPCFLARLGATRTQAATWLDWAENLGIYQGWDADEKHDQGLPRTPFYAWKLGLQRLRLGRYMATPSDDGERASRFSHVVPFADIESSDRELLDAFCRSVEGLLPTLAQFRVASMSGEAWGRAIGRLVHEFLEVPADRPEEAQVRAELLRGLSNLATWDDLRDSAKTKDALPLALVREYLHSQLEVLAGSQGEYLIGGVTVCGLQPMRPVPFQIVYLLGLSENLFPGSNTLSSFDLRDAERRPGDVRPAEARLYDFLATCLSAERKLYLSYNHHDLQKDQPLLPAGPLVGLQRFLSQYVLEAEMQPIAMPMHADDPRFLDRAEQPAYQDVLVQYRDSDRNLALLAARRDGRLDLNPAQQAEWQRKEAELRPDFSIPPSEADTAKTPINIHLSELKRFLELPAEASLRRHLSVGEEWDRAIDEDEPLVTGESTANAMIRHAIEQLVTQAATGEVEQALATWRDRFVDSYAESRLRSIVPEEAFGEIDRDAIVSDLHERIHGTGQLEQFLREKATQAYCGPVLLGESLTPLGARLRFTALTLRCGHELPDGARPIRISGSMPFAWHAPGRFEILVVNNVKEINLHELHYALLEPALFHLAILANGEYHDNGARGDRWLEKREFVVHIAHRAGISTWRYPPGCITAAQALHYFVELTRDFLDPVQFDLIPFAVIARTRELKIAVNADYTGQIAPERYRLQLAEAIAEADDNGYGGWSMPTLIEMIGAEIPHDVLAKVRRRFHLLDFGPASLRRQPMPAKPKRGAKK